VTRIKQDRSMCANFAAPVNSGATRRRITRASQTWVCRSAFLALAGIALGTAPGNLFATALPLTDSGILDLANSSINLVGVTTFPSPCINWGGGSTCGVLTTHLTDVAGVSNLFNSALPGTIMDLSTVPPPVVPDFETVVGAGALTGMIVHFDLESIPRTNGGAGFGNCASNAPNNTCSPAGSVFSFQENSSGTGVTVSFSALLDAYTGSVATGFTPYNATFQTTQTQTLNGSGACSGIAATITNILACEGASGTIAATWSATEGPQPIVMTGTPEPATLVLFGSGLLAVGFIGRRRFRRD